MNDPISSFERPPPPDAATLALPRILCLHGGGTNARVFHMQCRAIQHSLKAHFRLVFAEAPFPSLAGPDVLTVYADCGPFKRWVVTAEPNGVERQPRETWTAVQTVLGHVMDYDDALGATGEFVAVLGFSQGAKIAASLLLMQQEKPQFLGRLRRSDAGFRFGVCLNGRGPLLPTDPEASWVGERFDHDTNRANNRLLRIPTIHVHGLQDPGLGYHQVMLEDWCDSASTTLYEWDGNHRLPIKTVDVKPLADHIMRLAKQTGVKF